MSEFSLRTIKDGISSPTSSLPATIFPERQFYPKNGAGKFTSVEELDGEESLCGRIVGKNCPEPDADTQSSQEVE